MRPEVFQFGAWHVNGQELLQARVDGEEVQAGAIRRQLSELCVERAGRFRAKEP